MKTLKTTLLVIVFLAISNSLYSQKKLKWGKVSKEDISITECSFDKDAPAVVLHSKGNLSFSGYQVLIKKHFRIKILNENGLDYANREIIFYTKDDLESISSFKAQTININESGKKETIKVEKSQIFETKLDNDYKKISFTFPAVKVGSIIEYKYTVASKSITFLDAWVFQDEIPTLRSEFEAVITDDLGLDYSILYVGKRLLNKYSSLATSKWSLENIPGFYDENYVYSWKDNAEIIRFQLTGYRKKSATHAMDGSWTYEKFSASWDKFTNDILTSTSYQAFLNLNKLKVSNINKELISESDTKTERVTKIYNLVSQDYSWNGVYSMFPKENFAKFIKSKNGNSAEINLLLVALLQDAGLTAYPMILSTKSHGKISKEYPMFTLFNHVICALEIGSYTLLLDATNPYRPYTLLAIEDLNFWGFVLKQRKPEWKKIEIPKQTTRNIGGKIDYTNEGKTYYEYQIEYDGYFAVDKRRDYFNNKENFFLEDLDIQTSDLLLDSFKIENKFSFEKPFIITVYFHSENNPFSEGKELVYLEPFPIKHFEENPFKADKRFSPIDLAYTFSDNISLKIYYPDNYKVEASPKSSHKTLINNTKYTYYALPIDNYLKMESKLVVDETIFFIDEYKEIRSFFSEIINKPNEQIVLKK